MESLRPPLLYADSLEQGYSPRSRVGSLEGRGESNSFDYDDDSLAGAPLGRAFFANSDEADAYYGDRSPPRECTGDDGSIMTEWFDDPAARVRRRIVLMAAFAILFTRYCVATLQLAFFVQVALPVGIRVAWCGAIFTAYPLGMCFTWLISPLLIRRIGTKWSAMLALLVTAAATLLFGLLPDCYDVASVTLGARIPEWRSTMLAIGFFLCQCFNGMIGGVAESASIAVVTKSYAETPFMGPVMAAIGTVCGLGCIVGPPLGGFLYSIATGFRSVVDPDEDSWAFRLPFIVVSVVALALVGVAAFAFPNEFVVPEEKPVRWRTHCAPLKRVLSPTFVLSLIGVLLSSTIVSTLDTCLSIRTGAFLPQLNFMNLAPYVVGWLYSAAAIVYIFASIPVGWIIERYEGNSRVFKMIQAAGFLALAVSFSLLGPIWLHSAWDTDWSDDDIGGGWLRGGWRRAVAIALVVFALVLKGIGSAGSNAAFPDLLVTLDPESVEDQLTQDAVASAWNGVYTFGWAVGPLVGGLMFDSFRSEWWTGHLPEHDRAQKAAVLAHFGFGGYAMVICGIAVVSALVLSVASCFPCCLSKSFEGDGDDDDGVGKRTEMAQKESAKQGTHSPYAEGYAAGWATGYALSTDSVYLQSRQSSVELPQNGSPVSPRAAAAAIAALARSRRRSGTAGSAGTSSTNSIGKAVSAHLARRFMGPPRVTASGIVALFTSNERYGNSGASSPGGGAGRVSPYSRRRARSDPEERPSFERRSSVGVAGEDGRGRTTGGRRGRQRRRSTSVGGLPRTEGAAQ